MYTRNLRAGRLMAVAATVFIASASNAAIDLEEITGPQLPQLGSSFDADPVLPPQGDLGPIVNDVNVGDHEGDDVADVMAVTPAPGALMAFGLPLFMRRRKRA